MKLNQNFCSYFVLFFFLFLSNLNFPYVFTKKDYDSYHNHIHIKSSLKAIFSAQHPPINKIRLIVAVKWPIRHRQDSNQSEIAAH